MSTIYPQCKNCIFYQGKVMPGVLACKAFRNIPDEILFNEFDHREPYDKNGVSDNGITFEAKPGLKHPREASP